MARESAAHPDGAVRFCLLGPVGAVRGDEVLAIGGPGVRALLALLLLNAGQEAPVERIVDVLWNHEPPPTARTIVQGYVSRLRRWLSTVDPETWIETTGSGYRFVVDPEQLDVVLARRLLARARGREAAVRAELLAQAQALWRGPELSGIGGRVRAPELAELRLSVIEARLDADLELGRHDEVIGELAALVDTYPFREQLVGQFMLALHRAGRRAAALEVYQRFAHRAAGELGLDAGPALRELHGRVLRDDPALLRPGGRAVSPRAGVVPAELPAPPAGFTGRDPELAWLDALRAGADGSTPVIGVVAGPPGVGKTALAVSWGTRVASAFPDGALYASLRGVDPRTPPLPPAEALARFLPALGVAAEDVPVDPADRAALYRSLLAGRRVLVLLDDARDPEQVRPLLPGAGASLALVTSRRRLDGLVADGARLLVLDTLPADAAERLIEHVAGPVHGEGEAALRARLVRLCGYLPLALRIAGARLVASPQWTIEDLVAGLDDERARLSAPDVADADIGVRAALDLAHRGLDPAGARTLRLLGGVPGQWFGPHAVAAVCGVDVAEARARLRALAESSLVTEVERDLFGMHDLVRAYAREPADGADAPVRALLRHYLVAADAARRRLRAVVDELTPAADWPDVPRPDLDDRDAALAWFEREWPNLLAAVAAGAEAGCHDLVWRLARVAEEFRRVRPRRDDWEWLLARGLDSAIAAGDRRGEALLLLSRCVLLGRFGQARDSAADAQRAVDAATELGDQRLLAMALNTAASALHGDKRYQEALAGYRAALERARAAGHRVGEANLLNNIAQVHWSLDDPAAAAEPQRAAVEIFREVGDVAFAALALANLAELEHALGRFADAEGHAREAVSLAEAEGQELTEAFGREVLARVLRDQGDIGSARAELNLAVELYDLVRSPMAESARSALAALPPGV